MKDAKHLALAKKFHRIMTRSYAKASGNKTTTFESRSDAAKAAYLAAAKFHLEQLSK